MFWPYTSWRLSSLKIYKSRRYALQSTNLHQGPTIPWNSRHQIALIPSKIHELFPVTVVKMSKSTESAKGTTGVMITFDAFFLRPCLILPPRLVDFRWVVFPDNAGDKQTNKQTNKRVKLNTLYSHEHELQKMSQLLGPNFLWSLPFSNRRLSESDTFTTTVKI